MAKAKTHTIWVDPAVDGIGFNCLQIFDDDSEGKPKDNTKHESGKALRKDKVNVGDSFVWQNPSGTATLNITFSGDTPFVLTGNGSSTVTSGAIPNTTSPGRYKYAIRLTVTATGDLYSEDPQVIIDNMGVEGKRSKNKS